ncbi:MAG: BREX-6 system BrxE protein [Oligoflexia bacterium]|nr:BREX-6 system BrxE protein [Oligoflexia bacterium]
MTAVTPIPTSTLDHILAAQLIVAWAGESGEEPRLGWWRTDLVSEFGGQDLFGRLLPHTWRWAVLQGAREAARRRDASMRAKAHDPDQLITLFRLGFTIDERLDERLRDLKTTGRDPAKALPVLGEIVGEDWDRDAFSSWINAHPGSDAVAAPAGRRLKGAMPDSLELLAEHLVAALAPLADAYPLPHYRCSSSAAAS